MNVRTSVGIVACLVAVASMGPALAQASGAPAAPEIGNTVLVARYQCNPADHAKVDQILKEITAPVLNRLVAQGKLISWGVLGTYVGGPDTRTIFVWAKDPAALIKARAEYLPEIMSKPGWADVLRACPTQETSISNMILKAAPAEK